MQKILSVLFIISLPIAVVASPIDKANKYMDYGLSSDAKKIFIDIVFNEGSSDDHKAESHYRLGAIAFSENKLEIALEEWVLLQSNYPDQGEKLNISEKIATKTLEEQEKLSKLKEKNINKDFLDLF